MAFSYGWRGPNIVKEGLVLYLNADSLTSYNSYFPSNNWKDISGNGYDSTLINGALYVNDNGGGIRYDGVDDYVQGNNSLASEINDEITIISVAKFNDLLNKRNIIFSKYSTSEPFGIVFEVGTVPGLWTRTLRVYVGGSIIGSSNDSRGTVTINDGQNYMVTATYSRNLGVVKLYYNDIQITLNQVSDNNVDSTWSKGSNPYRLGSYRPFFNIDSDMTQYNCLVYNRVLSFSEITQNYNSFKPIYNI